MDLMLHKGAQYRVHARLIAGARVPEPLHYLGIEPQRNRLFAHGLDELSRRQPSGRRRWAVGILSRPAFCLRIRQLAHALPISSGRTTSFLVRRSVYTTVISMPSSTPIATHRSSP